MANNNTSFSALFNLDSRAQVMRAIEIAETCVDSETETAGFEVKALNETDPECKTIWIYTEESGSPDAVIDYVVKLAAEFRLTGKWGFTWAETCSRPRVDEFGGGAAVVNLRNGRVEYVNSHEWMQKKLAPRKAA